MFNIAGKPVKPAVLWAGGGLVALGAYFWYTKNQAANASTDATAPTDTSGTDPYNAYGDPSLASYDSSGGYGDYAGAPSMYGYFDPASGQFITGIGGNTQTVITPTSNAQWVQQVREYLIQDGYSATLVDLSLGKYILGQGLTDHELGVVQAAIGLMGYPPTKPPAPHLTPPPGHHKVPVPSGGLHAPTLHAKVLGPVRGELSWNKVPGAVSYRIFIGRHPQHLAITTRQSFDVPRHTGPYSVKAVNAGVSSHYSNQVHIK